MNLEIIKAKSYVGFAIKSRSIRFGVDDICKLKRAELVIVSGALQDSSLKKAISFCEKNHVDLVKLGIDDFENLLDNKSVKIFAILDKNLASIIKKILTSN